MNLIVPSKAESKSTGFLLAGEVDCRNKTLRVELWKDNVRCFLNGKPVKIDAMPVKIARKALNVAKTLTLTAKGFNAAQP